MSAPFSARASGLHADAVRMLLRRLDPRPLLNRLRSTYWFVPSAVTVSCVILALLLVALDRRVSGLPGWMGWVYGGGAAGARSLLSAVAGSTITVVSVTFSVLVVALTVSSQHFGPRLLNSFMRDNAAQLVLGTFTGTFVYCLLVLRTVQGDGGERYATFVPHLAVTAGFALAVLSVGMLIYYVHHVATSMQVSEITAGLARDLEQVVGRLYPERFGEGTELPVREPPPVPRQALAINARSSGYVQEIDSDAVLALAAAHGTTIWLTARPGAFVVEDTQIAAAHPPPQDADRFAKELAQSYVIGADRTSYQDAAFPVQQLVEVALRALSPGVNEPFTAITCIDRLTQGLTLLACRRIPSAMRTDGQGRLRVIARPRSFEDLLEAAFEPIAVFADRNAAVTAHLLRSLGQLAGAARRPEDVAAILRVADMALESAPDAAGEHPRLRRLVRLHADVRRAADRRVAVEPPDPAAD